ncbi:MAG TPA: hypothetical protein VFL46_04570, partial [Phycicoccus sp.]|nr:hypothetical protein [Phycicoccus sp.]
MRGEPYAEPLRRWLNAGWLGAVREGYARAGVPEDDAGVLALQSLAMARGLLFELAATGDRAAVDAAMAAWTEMVRRELGLSAGGPGAGRP